MAEYDLTPLVIDDDLEGTYELLRNYFVRGNNPFNVVSNFLGEDNFTFDIIRSYSFVASTHRATVHITGKPCEEGKGTQLLFHAKSVAEQKELEREIRNRLEDVLGHMLEEKRGLPVVDKNAVRDRKKEKQQLYIAIAVFAVIAIGAGITGILQDYSGFWSI